MTTEEAIAHLQEMGLIPTPFDPKTQKLVPLYDGPRASRHFMCTCSGGPYHGHCMSCYSGGPRPCRKCGKKHSRDEAIWLDCGVESLGDLIQDRKSPQKPAAPVIRAYKEGDRRLK